MEFIGQSIAKKFLINLFLMSFKYQKNNDVILQIKVSTGAKTNQIMGVEDDCLKIRVNARPEKGLANQLIINFLSKTFRIAKSHITIDQGLTSKKKVIILRDTSLKKIDEYFDGKTTSHTLL